MSIPVVLHVRTNIDWATMTEEGFLRQEQPPGSACPMSAEQRQALLRAIRLWDRTFRMSYFSYRQRLKEIAELSWTRIRNLDLILRRPGLSAILDILDEYIVLPVDDDDWFHPDIADVLRRRWRPGVDAFHWPDGLYRPVPFQERFDQSAHQIRLILRKLHADFATNGYALTRTGLSKCKAPLRGRVLAFHWAAGKTYRQDGFECCYVDRPLSASNKSLASRTNLQSLVDRSHLLRNVPHLMRRTTDIPQSLHWTREYIALTESLNLALCPASPGDEGPDANFRPKSRLQFLNYLIRTRQYKSYLELGCGRNRTFDGIVANHKIGVDPSRGGTLRMSSDEFFRVNARQFDLIFIDGSHLCEDVARDVQNSLQCLRAGGCIVLHDCLPVRREHQERCPQDGEWTGDVWKAVVALRCRSDCDVAVLDVDWGLGIVVPRPNSDVLAVVPELTWECYVAGRDPLLRVLDFPNLQRFLAGPAWGDESPEGAVATGNEPARSPHPDAEPVSSRGRKSESAPNAHGNRGQDGP